MAGFLDDDFDFRNPLGSIYRDRGGGAGRRQAAEYRRPMPKEQADTAGQQLLDAGKGGLSQLAAILNKPGRAVRGLIGGTPREAMALLPFSDTLGITDPKQEVTGAKLNANLGVPDDNSWGSWGAGLATDIALDPLTYATFGAKHALTAAGKAMKATDAGTQALKLMGRKQAIEQGVGQLAKLKLPFLPEIGTGKLGASLAGGMDAAANAIRYGNPVGLKLGQLFDYPVHRAGSKVGQQAMKMFGEPAAYQAQRAGDLLHSDVATHVADIVKAHPGIDPTEVSKAVRMRAEGTVPSPAVAGLPEVLPVDPSAWAATEPIAGKIARRGEQNASRVEVLGGARGRLDDDWADYMIRRASDELGIGRMKTGPQKDRSIISAFTGSNIRRQNPLRGIPGGTEMLNRWSVTRPDTMQAFRDMYLHAMAEGSHGFIDQDLMNFARKAEAGSDYFRDMLPGHTFTHERPFFSRNITGDVDLMTTRQARTERNLEAQLAGLGMMAREGPRALGQGRETVSLPAAMRLLGLKTRPAQGGAPMVGAAVQMLEKMGIDSKPFLMSPNKDAAKVLKTFQVPKDALREFSKDYAPWQLPEELKGPRQYGDSITNMFRNLAYAIWPASQVRNLMGGVTQTSSRPSSPGMWDVIKDLGRQVKLMRGHATPGDVERWTAGRFTDPAAYRREQFAGSGVYKGHNLAATELSGGPATLLKPGEVAGPIPGTGFVGSGNIATDTARLLGQGASGTLGRIRDKIQGKLEGPVFEMQGVQPLGLWDNTAGNLAGLFRGERPRIRQPGPVGTRDFPWLETGRRLGYNVESLLRGAQHLGLTRQGLSPSSIADEVWKTHFAYNRLTPFEKNVMRRVVPFYTFASRNIPAQIENLTTRPGRTMPWLRLGAQSRQGQFVPRHLASGAAIPVGSEDPSGNQEFLSQLGLPIEEFADRFKFDQGAPDLRNTAGAFAGAMNPILKGPLEWLFNHQLYSGRKLSDLRPQGVTGTIGELLGEDSQNIFAQGLANSPLTRIASTIDKIADPRKAWWGKALNLGTGLRVTDVDMPKMKAIETRRALEELLKHNPNISQYTSMYIKPEDQAKLTPEDTQRMQLLSRLQSNAQQYARENRMKLLQAR